MNGDRSTAGNETMGSNRKKARMLRQQAVAALNLSRTIMAASLAVDDGTLTIEEAGKLIEDEGDDSVVFSEFYPGDEYYACGDDELRRMF